MSRAVEVLFLGRRTAKKFSVVESSFAFWVRSNREKETQKQVHWQR